MNLRACGVTIQALASNSSHDDFAVQKLEDHDPQNDHDQNADRESDELPPLGIILCAGKKQEQIELLELDKSGIHVAEYLTVLPSKELLQAKLQESIAAARRRLPATLDESENE